MISSICKQTHSTQYMLGRCLESDQSRRLNFWPIIVKYCGFAFKKEFPMKCGLLRRLGRGMPVLALLSLSIIYASAQQQPVIAGNSSTREIAVTIKVTSNNPGGLHGLTRDDFKLAIGKSQRAILSAEELTNRGTANDSLTFNNLASLRQNKRVVAILLDEPNMVATAGTDVYREMAKSVSSLPKGEANFMVLLVDRAG